MFQPQLPVWLSARAALQKRLATSNDVLGLFALNPLRNRIGDRRQGIRCLVRHRVPRKHGDDPNGVTSHQHG